MVEQQRFVIQGFSTRDPEKVAEHLNNIAGLNQEGVAIPETFTLSDGSKYSYKKGEKPVCIKEAKEKKEKKAKKIYRIIDLEAITDLKELQRIAGFKSKSAVELRKAILKAQGDRHG